MLSNFFVLRFSGIAPYLSGGTFILPRANTGLVQPHHDRLYPAILKACVFPTLKLKTFSFILERTF